MIRPAVRQPVDEPRVTVEREHDRLVFGKKRVELPVAQAVGMFSARLQLHQVDDINHATLELREMGREDRNRGETSQGGYTPAAAHRNIRLGVSAGAGPPPDAN